VGTLNKPPAISTVRKKPPAINAALKRPPATNKPFKGLIRFRPDKKQD
jgi:hypothetical protein